MAEIAIEQLSVRFNTRRGTVQALENINLKVRDGEFVCLLGPSGCGKSTLSNVIAGLLEPTSGRVVMDGVPVQGKERQQRIGFVFQRPTLIPWKTTAKNIEFSLSSLGYRQPGDWRAMVQKQIDFIGLKGFEDAYPRELSGGMQSRVGLARAMVIEPQLLLMDEPFSSLDQITAGRMRTELLRVWETQRITTLFVTHDISEAVELADRIILLSPRPGRIHKEYLVPVPRPRNSADERLGALENEILHDLNAMPGMGDEDQQTGQGDQIQAHA